MDRAFSARKDNILGAMIAAVVLGVLALAGFSLIYAGKIYPGVSVNGIYLGGLNKAAALQQLQDQASQYDSQQIPVEYNRTTLRIPVKALGVQYREGGIDNALKIGRTGSLAEQLRQRIRSILGRSTVLANYSYDDSKLTPFIAQVDDDVTQPVANARLSFDGGVVGVTPSQPGHRLDRGLLTAAIGEHLAAMSTKTLPADIYVINPTINEDTLSAARHKADAYVAAPLTVKAGSEHQTVDQATILSWIDVTTPGGRTDMMTDPVKGFYPEPTRPVVDLKVSQDKVQVYVQSLAGSISQAPKNAVLASENGKVVVAEPSHDGVKLDQAKSTQLIMEGLSRTTSDRTVTLAATTVPADVNEHNLASLGITDLISEGQTFFPGSPSTRMTNIRVGAAKYDGVLLKAGQVFSFGEILGDVGPEQGYVPELVILGDHEEKQYGGGLCQVASTAYRAALLAGLPILERVNHAFAVSYYTAPYGVPGVDATIYYPQVDLKFKNDTGHAIYIQTHMQGTTLTFDYYGTKTKTGEIRGPQFISGSTDATQPSQTVFYRDIKDLNGNVIHTDTVTTYYKSSKDFPINKQFN